MPDPAPNPNPTPAPSDPSRGPRVVTKDPERRRSTLVDRLILKHGSVNRAMKALAADNIEQADKINDLTAENESLKATAPKKGDVVLSGDDAKHWPAVKALTVPLDKIPERVKRAEELEGTVSAQQRREKVREVAEKANVNGDTLEPLLTQFGLEVELKPITVQQDGKTETKQIAHIRKSGDQNAAWEPLADFVVKDGSPLKPFAASLAKTGAAGSTLNTGSTGAGGLVFPEQTGNRPSNDQGGSPVEKLLQRNAERSKQENPLTGATHAASPVIGGVPSHGLGEKQDWKAG